MPAPQLRRGVGVSPGSAVGPVVQVRPAPRPPADEPAPTDVEAAQKAVGSALASVADGLEERAARVEGTAAEVLKAGAMMARDRSLKKSVDAKLSAGVPPATALDRAVEEFCEQYAALGGYFAERVADLRDVRDRAVARLLGQPEPGIPELTGPSVVVAHDLAPAETATLDRSLVVAIVTEAGGRTSHTAILAAQMGIPAVVQLAEATSVPVGTLVAVDGDAGEVTLDPDEGVQRGLSRKAELRAAAVTGSRGPGRTADGHAVALLANIGNPDDAVAAGAMDLEGVGLFRTEFLFLDVATAPTIEEQAEIYIRVFEPFGDRRVVVRTLDAGADKPLAFADLGPEENPALGRRGLRLSAERPHLLDAQLEALGKAARTTGADVRVMAPMVATAEEAAWFARRVRENGLQSAGVMIEVPAAALRARHVLAEVDFGSLGTNDLTQYAMAADRMQGELSDLLDPWQPAVLDLVAAACEGGHATGRPVGVCGEAAGDPLLALVLTGLGVSSLSMAPSKVAMVRFALELHDLASCGAMAEAARAAAGPVQAREAVVTLAEGRLRDLV